MQGADGLLQVEAIAGRMAWCGAKCKRNTGRVNAIAQAGPFHGTVFSPSLVFALGANGF